MIKFSNSNIIKTIALCLLLQSNGMPPKNNAPAQKADEFYVFNVGQGNCNLFIPGDPKSGIILYDAGSTAGPFNKKIQRTGVDTQAIIDIITSGFEDKKKQHLEVVVSHADLDHLKYIQSIIQEVTETVEDLNVVINFGGNKNTYTAVNAKALIKFIEKKKKKIKAFYPSNRKIPDYYDMGLDTAHDTHILNWSKGSPNPNIDSLVLRISSENHDHSVLLTGDAENATFSGLEKEELKSTILVAPHHGAQTKNSYSDDIIKKIKPKYVVLSADGASHPAPYTVERYHNLGSIEKGKLLHLICNPGEAIESEGLVRLGEAYAYTGDGGRTAIQIYVTKHALYCTSFGTLKFTLDSPTVPPAPPSDGIKVEVVQDSISMGIPKNITDKEPMFKSVTNLTLINMALKDDDLIELAKYWLNLTGLTYLDISKNKINLLESDINNAIQDLIESLSEIKNHDFTIKMLPQKVKQKKS